MNIEELDIVGVKIYPPFEDDWIDSLVDAWLHQPDFPGWESAQDITRVVLSGLCKVFGGAVILVDPEVLDEAAASTPQGATEQ